MRSPWRYRLPTVLLVAAVAMGGLPGVGLADDDPDLKIEYVGVGLSPQVHVFKVSNVGDEDAEPTTATVETIARGPTNRQTVPVPRLRRNGGNHQFTYALTTDCDLTVVKATVSLPKDTNKDNDEIEAVLCDAKPPPLPPPPPPPPPVSVPPPLGSGPLSEANTEVAGIPPDPRSGVGDRVTDLEGRASLPQHHQPGEHTLVLEPSIVRSYFMDGFPEPGGCGPYEYWRYVAVGWFQVEQTRDGPFGIEIRDCAYVGESQTGVNFDYGILDEIPDRRITRAVLTFDESELEWRDTTASGCVAALDIATVLWDRPNLDYEPIPAEPYRDVTPNSARRFDTTSAVAQHVTNKRPRYGFVLRGSLSIFQLEGEGNSSCLSIIDNIRLHVTYVVLN